MENLIPQHENLREFSVSELSFALKTVLEETFSFVRVKGELTGVKRHSSGHLYFALKDEQAVLDGVSWRGTTSKLSVSPQDGLEVICCGRITSYPGRSKYQMIVESMELAGEGALLKLLEETKKRLSAEGLFDPALKKPLPFLPQTIGIITSPTGAVIQDILHRLSDRMPTRVLLWPVAVQGTTAAKEVTAAIDGFNALKSDSPIPKPDLLIVARGGGSLEDLWSFNEEIVVRAAARSEIPLISAVGHETDTTLIDYASDYRAPTPTGAAEKAVPVRSELLATLSSQQTRLANVMNRLLTEKKNYLQGLERGLPKPEHLLDTTTQRLDDWSERLNLSLLNFIQQKMGRVTDIASKLISPKDKIDLAASKADSLFKGLQDSYKTFFHNKSVELDRICDLLESYSFENTLKRGFTLVRSKTGSLVTLKEQAATESELSLQFQDGELQVYPSPPTVTRTAPSSPKTPAPASSRQKSFWD